MSILVLVLAILLFAFIALAFILLTAGPDRTKKIDITLDDGSRFEFTEDEAGIHFDLKRDDGGLRIPDSQLIPQCVDSTPLPDDGADIDFWRKLRDLDGLPTDEKKKIVNKLDAFGFIPKEQIGDINISDGDSEGKQDAPDGRSGSSGQVKAPVRRPDPVEAPPVRSGDDMSEVNDVLTGGLWGDESFDDESKDY